MRVGFVEGVLLVMILGLCLVFVPYLWCFLCCMFWGFFVPNFSGTFCLNKGRICWGCCALNIWIWGECCVKVVYGFLLFHSFQFFIRFLLLFYLFWVRFVEIVFMSLGSFVSWHFASWNINLTHGTFNLFFLFLKFLSFALFIAFPLFLSQFFSVAFSISLFVFTTFLT